MKDHAMKLLIFSVFCFISFSCFSQVTGDSSILKEFDFWKKYKGNNGLATPLQPQEDLLQKELQYNLLENKQGDLVELPQDHMPCVVPDTKDLALMSNFWVGVTIPYLPGTPAIPNPALPPRTFKYNAFNNSLGVPSK
jgi:hypothetical protein